AVEHRLGCDGYDHSGRVGGDGDDDGGGTAEAAERQYDVTGVQTSAGAICDAPIGLRVPGEAGRDESDEHLHLHGLQLLHGCADAGDDGDVHVVGAAQLHVRRERDAAVVQRAGGCDRDDHDWRIGSIRGNHGAGTERQLDV